jgi:cell volume regulation protein A
VNDTLAFGLLILCAAGAGLLAVQAHGLLQWLRIPAPAVFLAAAAFASEVIPGLPDPGQQTVERVVTLAVIVILFDGGLQIGIRRLRTAAAAIMSLGVLGTFATVAGACVLVHTVLGTNWYLSVLVATAIAPTDPAVVFSVLGRREVQGSSGTILEGESGANDPVGIALMVALLAAGSLSVGAIGDITGTFGLQMLVGLAVGLLGGRVLLIVMRRVPLPAEGLYPARTLVSAGVLFGAATVMHGSGFLAVFVAGIVLGDERAPYKREIERFHSALASLAEVVAFAFLGFTVDLFVLARTDVWVPGLAIGIGVALLVRPLVVLPLLMPARLSGGERAFVLFAGLKGAVPLLLGTLLLPMPGGDRLYGVVVVVVLVSVLLQGTLVPLAAKVLKVRMHIVEPEPYGHGVRLREQPEGAHHVSVASGAVADGSTIADLPGLAEGTWISTIVRDGQLVPVRSRTVLRSGDQILVLIDPEQSTSKVCALFATGHQVG